MVHSSCTDTAVNIPRLRIQYDNRHLTSWLPQGKTKKNTLWGYRKFCHCISLYISIMRWRNKNIAVRKQKITVRKVLSDYNLTTNPERREQALEHERRLARTRFAHNGDILALIHREGHIRQRLYLIAPEPRRIHLANILCFQQCHDSSSSKAALFPRVNFLLTRLFYHWPDRPAIESGDISAVLCDIFVRRTSLLFYSTWRA